MSDWILVFLTIIFTVIVARFILKKFNATFIFLASGIIILMIATLINGKSVLGDKTFGNMYLDIIAFITQSFETNVAGVGTIIMAVTGYAAYMDHIKASTKLAYLAVKPLSKIKNSYIVLAGIYLIGMLLKLVITSQSGLAMLLLATTFPIMMALGVNKITAASLLTLVCLDWGPNDGSTIFAADVAKMNVVDLFTNYQIIIGASSVIVLTIFIPFYYRYMDKRDEIKGISEEKSTTNIENANCPTYYSLLPLLPLLIVLISSLVGSVSIDVVTATFIGFIITFIIEFIRRKDRKSIPNDMKIIWKAMGNAFINIVTLIISASVFAEGIKQMSGISILAGWFSNMHSASILVIILMTLVTFGAAVIMGSGAASWFAFGPLAPEIAAKVGINSIGLIIPMELGAAIGRALSPVAGAVIAIAGHAGIDTMKVVKRSVVPQILSLIVTIVVSIILVKL